jgi:hypothetical protein
LINLPELSLEIPTRQRISVKCHAIMLSFRFSVRDDSRGIRVAPWENWGHLVHNETLFLDNLELA